MSEAELNECLLLPEDIICAHHYNKLGINDIVILLINLNMH